MKKKIVIEDTFLVFGNEQSEQGSYFFPNIDVLSDGSLIVMARYGSNNFSADGRQCVRKSSDLGRTWINMESPSFKLEQAEPQYEYRIGGISLVKGIHLIAVFSRVERTNGAESSFHPENDGVLPYETWIAHSYNNGETWEEYQKISSKLTKEELILDTRCVVANENDILVPIETWKDYEGIFKDIGQAPILIASHDGGKTWEDTYFVNREYIGTYYMWDQRLSTWKDKIFNTIWTNDIKKAEDTNIHITRSFDCGKTWSRLMPTPLKGQICAPCLMDENTVLCIFNDRGDKPGLRAVLSYNFGETWDLDEMCLIYDPQKSQKSVQRGESFFSTMMNYSFGGPNIVRLDNNTAIGVFYCKNANGSYIKGVKIKVG